MTTKVLAAAAPHAQRSPVLGYGLAALVSGCVWTLLLATLL
ncbi:hypothetical protein [Brevundimonas sp. Leaf363]|nr:hypothetical protein [Brevundimonas sp. Leaf363]